MAFLDQEVGEGRWLMALSGDHGALDIPEILAEEGGKGSRATSEDFIQVRRAFQGFHEGEGEPDDLTDSLIATLEFVRMPESRI